MSRPAALSCFAFSAITMIALGLARPTRWASWGMEFSRGEEAKARILSRCPNRGGRVRAGSTRPPH